MQSSYSYALSCGDYLTHDVTLLSNLNCTSGSTALTVGAHNIKIDLNGFTLSGTPSLTGIYVGEFKNLTVMDGSIIGFWAGINAFRSHNLTVDNVTFHNLAQGIVSVGGNSAIIKNNKFIDTTSPAISLRSNIAGLTSNSNKIYNNEFYRAFSAVDICGGPAKHNAIFNNLIWKSPDYGIHLNNATFNKITNNKILDNGDGSAVRLNDASYNEIVDNTVTEGDHNGITVLANASTGCSDSTWYGSTPRSVKNQIIGNRVSDFPILVNLGLGVSAAPIVEGNNIANNHFRNANTGVYLRPDTKYNYGKGNTYNNINFNVLDAGVSNSVE